MKKFRIDLRASDKGERKKAVKFLRDKGFKVIKRKDDTCRDFSYLKTKGASIYHDFEYFDTAMDDLLTLTLPRDWDLLIEAVNEKPQSKKDELIAEAKRRGFKEGVRFESMVSGKNKTVTGVFIYDELNNILKSNGNFIHYDNQWAEIIEEDVVPKVGRYRLRKAGSIWKIGCFNFNTTTLNTLITEVTPDSITIQGHKLSITKLKEIHEYIKNN